MLERGSHGLTPTSFSFGISDTVADSIEEEELSETENDLEGEDLSTRESDSEAKISLADEETTSGLHENGEEDLSISDSYSEDNVCYIEEDGEERCLGSQGSSYPKLGSSLMFGKRYDSKEFPRE